MQKHKVVLVPFPFDDLSATSSLIQRELGVLSPRLQHEVNIGLQKLLDLK